MNQKNMKKETCKNCVLVFGTFDIFHAGHVAFLREARSLGDAVVVNLAQDIVVQELKGEPPLHSWEERAQVLRQSGLVSEIFPGDKTRGMFSQIIAVKPSLIAFGYDQIRLKEAVDAWIKRYAFTIPTMTIGAYKPDKYKSSILRASYDRSQTTP
ncbi:MAG: adenylyltransferase/cytidyltransferase family protein [Patescibacteria group bacterium]|jgi:FAD synthetase